MSDNFAIIIIGLPGTGKTTLAQYLADKLGAVYYSSDIIHSELFNEAQIYHDRDYSADELSIIYSGLHYVVKIQAANRKNMIIEGVYRSSKERNRIIETLSVQKYTIIGVYLTCDDTIALKRVSERKASGTMSPAGTAGYWKIKEAFEPPVKDDDFVKIDGMLGIETNVEVIAEALSKALDSRKE